MGAAGVEESQRDGEAAEDSGEADEVVEPSERGLEARSRRRRPVGPDHRPEQRGGVVRRDALVDRVAAEVAIAAPSCFLALSLFLENESFQVEELAKPKIHVKN